MNSCKFRFLGLVVTTLFITGLIATPTEITTMKDASAVIKQSDLRTEKVGEVITASERSSALGINGGSLNAKEGEVIRMTSTKEGVVFNLNKTNAPFAINDREGNVIQNEGRPDCPAGTIADCSGDGDCCPESWIGDGFADCEDQAFGCDLTCYDNDGGDCGPDCAAGDINCDGSIDVVDVVNMVNAIIDGGTLDNGDINGDGSLDVVDVVLLVNYIIDGGARAMDADKATMTIADNSLRLSGNGYIGGVQMTLSHANGFELNLTENAMVSEYKTSGTTTTLVVVVPEEELLFTANQSFEVVNMIVANSEGEIEVSTVSEFGLTAAYPNPFNPSTTVTLAVPTADFVSVKVYNLVGQVVGVLAEGMMDANTYTLTWNAADMSSGVYLIRAESGSSVDIQKVLLVK